jgi:N-acetylglucosaminyldiphosphoundecaprenol N-acetyl-beta-D-mannosaminyltransferase
MDGALDAIRQMLVDGRQHFVATPNPEMIVEAVRDSEFKDVLNRADLAIPDGTGLLWAARFLNTQTKRPRLFGYLSLLSLIFFPPYCKKPLPERVSGIDLVTKLAEQHAGAPVKQHLSQNSKDDSQDAQTLSHVTNPLQTRLCAERPGLCSNWQVQFGRSVTWFLLGAAEGVAEKAKEELQKKHHDLDIVGTYSGTPHDHKAIELINNTQPNLLLVAFGHGKQEKWIIDNLSKIPSVKVAIGVGGTLDFLAGNVSRAPQWMRTLKLEWLWRLCMEPRRIKRIWTATVTFPRMIIRAKTEKTNYDNIRTESS